MFRKYSIAALLAGLALLIGIYFLIDYTRSKDRTFKSKVLSFNPEQVSRVTVSDAQSGDKADMKLENGQWVIYSNDKIYSGAQDAIINAMAMLNQLNTESIVATKSDKWADYHVNDDMAIHIEIFVGNNITGDLYVGKFDFKQIPAQQPGQQPQTKMTSYVRPADDDKVYAVNGILRSNFQGGVTPFRNRTLFSADQPADITKVSINGPAGLVVLENNGGQWLVNGAPADSTKTDRYLHSLSRLRSSNFIDDVDLHGQKPIYTMEIEGSTFAPATPNAFPADSVIVHYLSSSLNPGTIFDGAKGKTFEKAFVGADAFLSE